MKLFDIFDKSGDKIGEAHGERRGDPDFTGLVVTLITIILGIIFWAFVLSDLTDKEKITPALLALAVVLVTDIICMVVRICFMRHNNDEFGELFWGFLCISAIITGIVFCLFASKGEDGLSGSMAFAMFFGAFIFQSIPSLIMAAISKALQ